MGYNENILIIVMPPSTFSEKVLNYLKETSQDILERSMDVIFNPGKVAGISLYGSPGRSFYYSKHIANLKRSPCFSFRNDKFYLTIEGRIRIIKKIIKEKKDAKQWDKKWRAVIFDVPEINRRHRTFLRAELKWMGFVELQHSIWISPYHIERELKCLLELWRRDFTGDIRILKIDEITDDERFQKFFFSKKIRPDKK